MFAYSQCLAVDLGINRSAVCSVMSAEGTVMGRKFINQPIEKDRMYTLINRLKKVQKQSGNQAKCKRMWRKINNLNKQIVNDTIRQIMKMAAAYRVDVIVFEYLDFTGQKKHGALVKTQMWAKQTIQEKVKHKAHVLGIRMNRINARNTSALAYDGSGKVKRLGINASLCVFTNKKPCDSDLNAAYNIGARYVIQAS